MKSLLILSYNTSNFRLATFNITANLMHVMSIIRGRDPARFPSATGLIYVFWAPSFTLIHRTVFCESYFRETRFRCVCYRKGQVEETVVVNH